MFKIRYEETTPEGVPSVNILKVEAADTTEALQKWEEFLITKERDPSEFKVLKCWDKEEVEEPVTDDKVSQEPSVQTTV